MFCDEVSRFVSSELFVGNQSFSYDDALDIGIVIVAVAAVGILFCDVVWYYFYLWFLVLA